mmetsp:Transcript_7317/g.15967  ORF Transcript_7317/g.15967 Transcript_7317/m.15967 type:complete len:274 (-) Transcript_7317:732-1553(-)|eukprot:CAMPEP_0202900804 /NCGR_PEP_ID=MMETSP1392-20130828/12042_1 /ASSEMBLY_ACC=CAM_ASM_000868 /TAXON_ID=225041 /ORGANISM="Chlamydomonas chlamydogama, Strain SAG 11-48b" /LENGTH=273 /DNA_ID=CAMNT_0049587249 /DNA_START=77 /DNA_END=898 /DNA_ORIENTATION=+
MVQRYVKLAFRTYRTLRTFAQNGGCRVDTSFGSHSPALSQQEYSTALKATVLGSAVSANRTGQLMFSGLLAKLRASKSSKKGGGFFSKSYRHGSSSSAFSQCLQVERTQSCIVGQPLKSWMPYTFEGSGLNIGPDTKVEDLNAAFESVSKDPVWLWTAIDQRPLGKMRWQGYIKKADESFLDFVNLDQSKSMHVRKSDKSEVNGSAASKQCKNSEAGVLELLAELDDVLQTRSMSVTVQPSPRTSMASTISEDEALLAFAVGCNSSPLVAAHA